MRFGKRADGHGSDLSRRGPRGGAGGFTLLEVLLASAMGVLILVAAYAVFESGQSTYTRAERKTDIQQNARAAMDTLVRQIRMAGYANLNSVDNAIVIGAADRLVIRGDVRLAGLPSPGADTIFAVRTTANADCPAPPCLMSHAAEAAGQNVYTGDEARLPLAFAITSIAFNYFDANNVELAPPLDGANTYPASPAPVDLTGEVTAVRDSVRRIRVTIIASDPRTFAGPGTTGPQTYTLIEDIRVRNKN